jgi:hypothetical protein
MNRAASSKFEFEFLSCCIVHNLERPEGNGVAQHSRLREREEKKRVSWSTDGEIQVLLPLHETHSFLDLCTSFLCAFPERSVTCNINIASAGAMKPNWAKIFFISCLLGTAGLVYQIHLDQEDQKRERRESVMKYLEEREKTKNRS